MRRASLISAARTATRRGAVRRFSTQPLAAEADEASTVFAPVTMLREEEMMMKDAAAAFAATEVMPRVQEMDAQACMPPELITSMCVHFISPCPMARRVAPVLRPSCAPVLTS